MAYTRPSHRPATGQPTAHPWAAHGLPKGCPRPAQGALAGFPNATHGSRIAYACGVEPRMTNPRSTSQSRPVVSSWPLYPWTDSGLPMPYPCVSHDLPVACQWPTNGPRTARPWRAHALPREFHGSPRGCPRPTHGSIMVRILPAHGGPMARTCPIQDPPQGVPRGIPRLTVNPRNKEVR